MALRFYKKSAAMVISYGTKTKKSQQGDYTTTTLNFQFAPTLKENPNGLGYIYDWQENKIVFQLSLSEALIFVEQIEIASKKKNWNKCKLYHKYNDVSKTLNLIPYKSIYTIHIQTGMTKLTLGLSVEELKMFIDYIKFASLSELVKDGEYYFQNINKIQNEKGADIIDDIEENEAVESEDSDFSDIEF